MNTIRIGMTRQETWGEAYVKCLNLALSQGHYRRSRDGDTIELGPTFMALSDGPKWTKLPGRGGTKDFAEAEQLCYLAGSDPSPLTLVSKRYERYRDNADAGGQWWGAYGPRLLDSLPEAAAELHARPDSRRCVVPIWEPRDLVHAAENGEAAKDVPCTLNLTFWHDHEKLHAHVNMRSCDLWFGLYYDAPSYRMLQRVMAWAVWKREPGGLWISITSTHLYERHRDKAKLVGTEPEEEWELELPKRNEFPRDPREAMEGLQVWAQHRLGAIIAKEAQGGMLPPGHPDYAEEPKHGS